ncbi:hypothetical protein DRN52_05815 [Thermococci archaeon]|nr:MAG: hypothetical protein DRN52_05815 [Thermococci archaeon]
MLTKWEKKQREKRKRILERLLWLETQFREFQTSVFRGPAECWQHFFIISGMRDKVHQASPEFAEADKLSEEATRQWNQTLQLTETGKRISEIIQTHSGLVDEMRKPLDEEAKKIAKQLFKDDFVFGGIICPFGRGECGCDGGICYYTMKGRIISFRRDGRILHARLPDGMDGKELLRVMAKLLGKKQQK